MSKDDSSGSSSNVGKFDSGIHLRDDTLTRKMPSFTFEKYVTHTSGLNIEEEEKGDHSKKASEENKAFAHNHNDTNQDDTKEEEDFELNLKGGSPMLNDFQNPFDETPKVVKTKAILENEDTPIFSDSEKFPIADIEGRILKSSNFSLSPSLITDADKFRRLKEKHLDAKTYPNLDFSNVGLIIDTRKSDEHDENEENTNDDSSIKLNLIPNNSRSRNSIDTPIINTKKLGTRIETQIENGGATQADGNVHEFANQISKNLRNSAIDDDENDVDDGYFLIGDPDAGNFQYSSNDSEKKALTQSPVLYATQNIDEDEDIDEVDTLRRPLNVPASLRRSNKMIHPSPRENLNAELFTTSTQEISTSSQKHIKLTDETKKDLIPSDNSDTKLRMILKETQIIGNISQSFVLDEDIIGEESDREGTNIDLLESGRGRDEDYEDDEDEIIKNKNTIKTFKVNDTQNNNTQNNDKTESSELKMTQRIDPNKEMEDNNYYGLPETQKIKDQQDIDMMDNISSPIISILENDGNSDSKIDGYTGEVPNTSALSISKIDIQVEDTNKIDTEVSENELKPDTLPKLKSHTSSPSLLRISDLQMNDENEEQRDITTSAKVLERLNSAFKDDDNIPKTPRDRIVRNLKKRDYTITDVLDCNDVFFMNLTKRIPGSIVSILEKGDHRYVTIKTKNNEEVVVEHSKLYAPICFDIGDAIKYVNDKRTNFIITGLSIEVYNKDEICDIRTVDGFNTIHMKSTNKSNDEEIAVPIEDIYLTGAISRSYKYKLFNNEDDFKEYVDYQINKFKLNGSEADSSSLNPNDTLIQLLKNDEVEPYKPRNINDGNEIRASSFLNTNKKGPFYKCLFVITGLNNSPMSSGSVYGMKIGNSRQSSPRKQKDQFELNALIEFIKLQGGSIIQETGFEEIIRFKKIPSKTKQTPNVTISPRKKKLLEMLGKANDTKELKLSKIENNFKYYECVKEKKDFYECFIQGEDTIEIEEHIKDFEFACVLSSRHVRTLKYLECLSLKWPILNIEFIKRCMEDKELLIKWRKKWMKYLLISGESTLLNCSIGLDIFKYYDNWKEGITLKDQLLNNDIFKKKSTMIITDEEATKFFELYENGKNLKSGDKRKTAISSREIQRKRKRTFSYNEDTDSEIDETNEEEEDGDNNREQYARESLHNTIEGPTSNETLLWIFQKMGVEKCYILKYDSVPYNVIGRITENEKGTIFLYCKGGCKDLSGSVHEDSSICVIDWEWIVQRLISGV